MHACSNVLIVNFKKVGSLQKHYLGFTLARPKKKKKISVYVWLYHKTLVFTFVCVTKHNLASTPNCLKA